MHLVIVPVRAAVLGLASTWYDTTPTPMPVSFEVIVIQLALLTASQMHSSLEITLMLAPTQGMLEIGSCHDLKSSAIDTAKRRSI